MNKPVYMEINLKNQKKTKQNKTKKHWLMLI